MGVPEEAERLLGSEPLEAQLATSVDDRPHVAPLWFRYAGDDVVEIMTTGQKLANVRRNPRVALAVSKSVDGHPEWQVVMRGTATVVEDEATAREANRKLNQKYGAEPDAWAENTLVRIDVASTNYRHQGQASAVQDEGSVSAPDETSNAGIED